MNHRSDFRKPRLRMRCLCVTSLEMSHIIHGRLNNLLHVRKTGAITSRCCDSCLLVCDFVFEFEARDASLESRYEGLHRYSWNYSFHRSESADKTLFLSFTWLFLSRLLLLCCFLGVSVHFDTWRDIYNPDPCHTEGFFIHLGLSCGKYT